MDIEAVQKYCMSLPHTTETVQWGNDLVFKIGGKMYAVTALEAGDHWLSFKCSPADFADLVERPGIVPAPYLARAHWVALQRRDALTAGETKSYLKKAYDLVFERLPKRTQAQLS